LWALPTPASAARLTALFKNAYTRVFFKGFFSESARCTATVKLFAGSRKRVKGVTLAGDLGREAPRSKSFDFRRVQVLIKLFEKVCGCGQSPRFYLFIIFIRAEKEKDLGDFIPKPLTSAARLTAFLRTRIRAFF